MAGGVDGEEARLELAGHAPLDGEEVRLELAGHAPLEVHAVRLHRPVPLPVPPLRFSLRPTRHRVSL
jgi:hypothetical protein